MGRFKTMSYLFRRKTASKQGSKQRNQVLLQVRGEEEFWKFTKAVIGELRQRNRAWKKNERKPSKNSSAPELPPWWERKNKPCLMDVHTKHN